MKIGKEMNVFSVNKLQPDNLRDTLRAFRKFSLLNRKNPDPGKFIFTGKAPAEEIDVQLFRYNKKEFKEEKSISPAAIEKFHDYHYCYWLNVYGLNEPETIASICQKQDIHNLVIQDILDVNQRPKFQEFDSFFFLTIKSIVPSDNELITEQISFVVGENYLISFQERKADFFEHLRFRLREDKGIIKERGSDYLLYTMLESILDNYFKTLYHLDNEVEKLNFFDPVKRTIA
jgi:magnesium transporter